MSVKPLFFYIQCSFAKAWPYQVLLKCQKQKEILFNNHQSKLKKKSVNTESNNVRLTECKLSRWSNAFKFSSYSKLCLTNTFRCADCMYLKTKIWIEISKFLSFGIY